MVSSFSPIHLSRARQFGKEPRHYTYEIEPDSALAWERFVGLLDEVRDLIEEMEDRLLSDQGVSDVASKLRLKGQRIQATAGDIGQEFIETEARLTDLVDQGMLSEGYLLEHRDFVASHEQRTTALIDKLQSLDPGGSSPSIGETILEIKSLLPPENEWTEDLPTSGEEGSVSCDLPSLILDEPSAASARLRPEVAQRAPRPEDLGETIDVQITSEIVALARDVLGGDPSKIFSFVYNNFTYVPYYGSGSCSGRRRPS